MILVDVVIRTADVDDALCISALEQQVFIDTYATDGIRPSLAREVQRQCSTSRIEARLLEADSRTVVAERRGHVIGFARVKFGTICHLIDSVRQSEVETLYVLRQFKRNGLGSALLREAERLAKREVSGIAWLTVWSGNDDARKFYLANGYRDVGVTEHVLEGESVENRLLVRDLSP